ARRTIAETAVFPRSMPFASPPAYDLRRRSLSVLPAPAGCRHRTSCNRFPATAKPQRGDRTMLPSPLHPIVVHFPIALVALLPLVMVACLLVIRRHPTIARRAWAVPVVAAAMLSLSHMA